MLMGKLAGPVVQAAFRGQPVDDVFLVENIPRREVKMAEE